MHSALIYRSSLTKASKALSDRPPFQLELAYQLMGGLGYAALGLVVFISTRKGTPVSCYDICLSASEG